MKGLGGQAQNPAAGKKFVAVRGGGVGLARRTAVVVHVKPEAGPGRVMQARQAGAQAGGTGAAAQTGQPIRIDDAYADARFNRDVDRQTGFRTRSVISLPIKNQEGRVFAVAQLLNRKDGQPFNADDEERFGSFIASLGVILETLQGLSAAAGGQAAGLSAGPG